MDLAIRNEYGCPCPSVLEIVASRLPPLSSGSLLLRGLLSARRLSAPPVQPAALGSRIRPHRPCFPRRPAVSVFSFPPPPPLGFSAPLFGREPALSFPASSPDHRAAFPPPTGPPSAPAPPCPYNTIIRLYCYLSRGFQRFFSRGILCQQA